MNSVDCAQHGQAAAIIKCLQHRLPAWPASWKISKACSRTAMNLLRDSIWLSTGARGNTGATWRNDPASAGTAPELTRSIDRHHNGTGKCACRGFGKRHEAGSNPESRFCTTLACNTDCIAGHPTNRWMHDLLNHKGLSLRQDTPWALQA